MAVDGYSFLRAITSLEPVIEKETLGQICFALV